MKRTLVLLLCLGLCGCLPNKVITYDYGANTLTQENIDKIIRGKTTKAEVSTILGNPQMKQKSAFGEIWTYTRSITKMNAFGGYVPDGSKTSSLSLTFDDNGVVKDINSFEMGSMMTGTVKVEDVTKEKKK